MKIDREDFLRFLAAKAEIVIEDDQKYVSNFAYTDYVNAKKLTLGKSVIQIVNGPFYGCSALEQIDLGQNKKFALQGDCLIHKEKKYLALCIGIPHVPDNVKTLNMTCYTKKEEVETFRIGKSLQKIERALRCFNIQNLDLHPENPYFTLEGNCLFSKDTGELVLGCENSIIPERTARIGIEAFANCNIKKVHIPGNVCGIDSAVFSNCDMLEEVSFDEGISRIESGAFSGCTQLKSISLPKSVSFMGERTFRGCRSLKSIESFGSIDWIKEYTFDGCTSLGMIDLPAEIDNIWAGAFSGCIHLKRAVLRGDIDCIYEETFSSCESLVEVQLPPSVTKIYPRAFYGCKNLEKINMDHVAEIGEDTFSRCDKLVLRKP